VLGTLAGVGGAPYRIETERLVLRCWEPRDAPLLKAAVDANLDHLRPWMPWAHDEPVPVADMARRLQGFRARFDSGEDFIYGVLDPAESEALGGGGLHRRVGGDAFEIGYWVPSDRVREGLATELAAALTRVAFDVCGVERMEIHADARNTPSQGVPRRLGYSRRRRCGDGCRPARPDHPAAT
jgi:RimJ/RimL family protein N-acetyltransferase